MYFIKEAISYKGLKNLRRDLGKARNLTKSIEKNYNRREAIEGVGKIRDLAIRNKKYVQTNDDWKLIHEFKPLEKRLISLYKEGKLLNLKNPKDIKIPNAFKDISKKVNKGKNETKVVNKTTKELKNKT